jgi:hypothetical protein
MSDELVSNAGGWPMLRKRLTKVFGPEAALFLEHLIFYSGKSHARWGWVWKSRDELEDIESGIGLGNAYQTKARKILRGEKATPRVVAECRPSRRRATFYRVDLVAVADLIGVEISESFHVTTQTMEAPEEDPESFQETTQWLQETTESFQETASVETSVETSVDSLLQRAAEPADAEPAVPEMNGKKEDKHPSPPVGDKRHSQDSDTPGQRTAGKKKVEEPVAPPKPNDDALLAEVKEILNPDSGRWHLATHVSAKHTAQTVAKGIVSEDDTGEVVHSVPYEDVEAAIEYLRWEADEGNNRREGHPDGCGCLPCKVSSATNKDVGKDGK